MQYSTDGLTGDDVALYGGALDSVATAAAVRQHHDSLAAAANSLAAAGYRNAAQQAASSLQNPAAGLLVGNAHAAFNEQSRVRAWMQAAAAQAAVQAAARNQSIAGLPNGTSAADASTIYQAQVLQQALREQQQQVSEAAAAESELAEWALRLRRSSGDNSSINLHRSSSIGSGAPSAASASSSEVEVIEKLEALPSSLKSKELKKIRGNSTSSSLSSNKLSSLANTLYNREKMQALSKSSSISALSKKDLSSLLPSSKRKKIDERSNLLENINDNKLSDAYSLMRKDSGYPPSKRKKKVKRSSSEGMKLPSPKNSSSKSIPSLKQKIQKSPSLSTSSLPLDSKHHQSQKGKQQQQKKSSMSPIVSSMVDKVILSLLIDAGAISSNKKDGSLPDMITLTTPQLQMIAQKIVQERENAIKHAVDQTIEIMKGKNYANLESSTNTKKDLPKTTNKSQKSSKDDEEDNNDEDDGDDEIVTLKVVPATKLGLEGEKDVEKGKDEKDTGDGTSKQSQTIIQLRRNLQTLIQERGTMTHEMKMLRAHLHDSQRVHKRSLQAYMKASIHALDQLQQKTGSQSRGVKMIEGSMEMADNSKGGIAGTASKPPTTTGTAALKSKGKLIRKETRD